MKAATNQVNDNQLITLFKQGNNNALETLINRHKERIFTSIIILTKDKYLAEDLFQDLFIKIIDTLRDGRYNEEGKFLPWALRVAHNLVVDHFRKVNRKPPIVTSDKQDIFEAINVVEESADESMMRFQGNERIRRIVDMLPEEQREVIVLRHYADLSFKEIAEITNCSINTALGRMRYGLMNLRKLMAEKQIAY